MRIFTAVAFKKETREFLGGLKGYVESAYSGARYTEEYNFHMTLVFIGESDRETVNRVIRATAGTSGEIQRFEMEMGGLSSFRRRNKHTVYCRARHTVELDELYETMCKKLDDEGVVIDAKTFRPHITMARQAVRTGNLDEIKTPVHICYLDEICVMESTRVNGVLRYIPLAKFKLGGR